MDKWVAHPPYSKKVRYIVREVQILSFCSLYVVPVSAKVSPGSSGGQPGERKGATVLINKLTFYFQFPRERLASSHNLNCL